MIAPSARNTRSAAALLPLLIEMNDLKRVRVPERVGSIASRSFRRAWAALVAGEEIAAVARREAAHAVAAARLAGIDAQVLHAGGLAQEQIRAVLHRSFDAVGGMIVEAARNEIRAALTPEPLNEPDRVPPFVELLCAQPRAGATRPDHPRVVLEPAENHGDHCGTVAIYAVLCAPLFDADPVLPFVCGLAHHLQNAYLPDAGYAGDELVGEFIAPMTRRFREHAIDQLPAALHEIVWQALDLQFRADSAEAQAFQAADVIDRVLEMRWHAQSAAFTLDVALGEMDIVHPGPVQQFQQELLRDVGIL